MASSSQVDLSVASLFNVKDKIALVSGGGSGIGLMIAGALVQNGAKVYIASRKEKQLREVGYCLIFLNEFRELISLWLWNRPKRR